MSFFDRTFSPVLPVDLISDRNLRYRISQRVVSIGVSASLNQAPLDTVESTETRIDICKNLKYPESLSGRSWAGWGGVWSPTRSVGARATAERSEAVRGAEGAEKPLLLLKRNRVKY